MGLTGGYICICFFADTCSVVSDGIFLGGVASPGSDCDVRDVTKIVGDFLENCLKLFAGLIHSGSLAYKEGKVAICCRYNRCFYQNEYCSSW